MSELIAQQKPVPSGIKSVWLDVQCHPEPSTGIPRLVITLELNGKPYRQLVNEYVGEYAGIISHGHNLTWLLHLS